MWSVCLVPYLHRTCSCPPYELLYLAKPICPGCVFLSSMFKLIPKPQDPGNPTETGLDAADKWGHGGSVDPRLGENDVRVHLESTEPEILMTAEVDWLQEIWRKRERWKRWRSPIPTCKDTVSHITTLKGTNALTFPLS